MADKKKTRHRLPALDGLRYPLRRLPPELHLPIKPISTATRKPTPVLDEYYRCTGCTCCAKACLMDAIRMM